MAKALRLLTLASLFLVFSGQSLPPARIADEGTVQGVYSVLNCVGSGIACTHSGNTGTITVSGGGGSDTFCSVEQDGVAISTAAPTLDFDSSDFTITESPTDDFDIAINNSGITITESQISDLSHTTDTNANTICTGTDVYLDGEGNCDTITQHSAATVLDSSEIDFTLSGQQITGSLITGSIDETKLDTSTNASLDLADSSVQPGDNISALTNDSGYLTSAPVSSVNTQTGAVVLDADDISDTLTTNKFATASELSDIAANTAARHSAATVLDTSEIDLTLTGQQISAAIVTGSIDETKLDTSTNASLDLADSSTQPGDNVSTLTNDAGYLTSAPVSSVNSLTGAVVLDADDISDAATTNKFTTAAEISKLAGIETGADVTDETNVVSSLNGATLTAVTVATGDKVLIQDVSDSNNIKTVTAQSIADLGSGGGSGPLDKSVTDVTVENTTTETAIFSYTIPADTLGTTNMIRVAMAGRAINNSGANRSLTLRVKLGSTTIYDDVRTAITTNSREMGFRLELELKNNGSTSSQILTGQGLLGAQGTTTNGYGDWGSDEIYSNATLGGTSSEDTTADKDLVVTVQWDGASANASITKSWHIVELF